MDFQRIFILIGLAVTAYLIILAWNDDYGKKTTIPQELVVDQTQNIPSDLPEISDLVVNDDSELVPQLELGNDTSVPSIQTQASSSSRQVTITTNVLVLQIDLLGGDIIRGALPKFPAELATPDIPFVLLDPRNTYSARSGLIGPNGTDKAKQRPLFSTVDTSYTMGDEDLLQVDLKLPESNGVSIIKRFTFKRDDYLVRVEYLVNNQSNQDWQATIYAQIKRDGVNPVTQETSAMGMQPFVGAATYQDGSPYTKVTFDDLEDGPYKNKVDGGYIAFVQHYFVTAWIPADDDQYTYTGKYLKNQDLYLFGLVGRNWLVPAGSQDSKAAQFYIGPKDQYKLEEISRGLDLTVDYGFLWWLAKPLFWLLTNIQSFVGNWGLAIILLTVVVKSVLFPLSAASFRSMAKLRKLQPEMAKLKERYGDDRQKFSQATMDLYKKEGANPLGGCLPMLLQMPVFLALYWTLMESVELRQAPFIFWIHDLSTMDPYFVLPILMGISMYLTQMMQPAPPDPMQAKVFKLMPIMFTVFFLWFPSGLVLYWLSNNLLSILQQWYVTRQLDKSS